jgi:hypothetical protein
LLSASKNARPFTRRRPASGGNGRPETDAGACCSDGGWRDASGVGAEEQAARSASTAIAEKRIGVTKRHASMGADLHNHSVETTLYPIAYSAVYGWNDNWTLYDYMVHYDPALAAIRQPPPSCRECGSHRTLVVGLADDARTVIIRCNACGKSSEVKTG